MTLVGEKLKREAIKNQRQSYLSLADRAVDPIVRQELVDAANASNDALFLRCNIYQFVYCPDCGERLIAAESISMSGEQL